jgi:hypothetical protein
VTLVKDMDDAKLAELAQERLPQRTGLATAAAAELRRRRLDEEREEQHHIGLDNVGMALRELHRISMTVYLYTRSWDEAKTILHRFWTVAVEYEAGHLTFHNDQVPSLALTFPEGCQATMWFPSTSTGGQVNPPEEMVDFLMDIGEHVRYWR